MKKINPIIVFVFFTLFQPLNVFAQGASSGADVWTRAFEQWGLFTPHEDYCDSTEVFISVGGTSSRGFCMEINERSSATWVTARDNCAGDKKRLPEPGEFKWACGNATGLNDMTDNYEWSSNFPESLLHYSGTATTGGLVVPYIGNGNCDTANVGWVARSTGGGLAESVAYRCVR